MQTERPCRSTHVLAGGVEVAVEGSRALRGLNEIPGEYTSYLTRSAKGTA
ncbi:hypothetical protein VFPFJ_00626 [Purpureocillium lilacinum]|uniref:Uncharacterized protein n=1 Tax=Purpureocillium lilacinum TaxID=33203 RepID=A0A179H8G0_PURLI|nr:hypothetical protein VFPFJ_00626 [Purpureocillium lilacinum]OAQ86556.1 hypothetical protein VFPBJ_00596 [Purpureocillium lilacinum]OAQ94517.1 hypothetical protein VFPFJ_00626 [Purpureocillium lilacinum]